MLTCECFGSSLNDPGDTWYFPPTDFSVFKGTKKGRRKRCTSCNKLINIGDLCVKFTRARNPYTEIEYRISGYSPHGIKIPSVFMCERCGEIYLNLNSLGYCFSLEGVSMEEMLKEYHKITDFKPKKRGNNENK